MTYKPPSRTDHIRLFIKVVEEDGELSKLPTWLRMMVYNHLWYVGAWYQNDEAYFTGAAKEAAPTFIKYRHQIMSRLVDLLQLVEDKDNKLSTDPKPNAFTHSLAEIALFTQGLATILSIFGLGRMFYRSPRLRTKDIEAAQLLQ